MKTLINKVGGGIILTLYGAIMAALLIVQLGKVDLRLNVDVLPLIVEYEQVMKKDDPDQPYGESCRMSEAVLLQPQVEGLKLSIAEKEVLSSALCSTPRVVANLSITPAVSTPQPVEAPSTDTVVEVLREDTQKAPEKPAVTIDAPSKVYVGQAAVNVVTDLEGSLTPAMVQVVLDEGYSTGEYDDSKGTSTDGVGQTGTYQGMTFKETFAVHLNIAKNLFPQLDGFSGTLRSHVISSVYRGGVTGSPKTTAFIVGGCYDLAADEFLNNEEYRQAKISKSGVAKRMERLSNALRAEKQPSDAVCGS